MKKIAFTIVLNGMPFILKQSEIIPELFDEWHIIEGATHPIKDTKWCKRIDMSFYNVEDGPLFGCSTDGTSQYLDRIKEAYPDKVFIHRKGDLWDGKIEMCQAIEDRLENCILMQIDVDELWQPRIIKDIFKYCEENDDFNVMRFKCFYYVGPDLVIKDENTEPNDTTLWTRLWKIKDKTTWVSHEPPTLKNLDNFLSKEFTGKRGWTFEHFAYVLESQLDFKENFYGYYGAKRAWQIMQKCEDNRFKLNRFFTWTKNHDIVERIKR